MLVTYEIRKSSLMLLVVRTEVFLGLLYSKSNKEEVEREP